MTRSRSMRTATLAFSGAALVTLSVGFWLLTPSTPQAEAETFTVDVLDGPDSEADRVARGKLKVPLDEVELRKGKKLGEDAQGDVYLLAPRGRDLCLVVIQDAESAAFTCNPASRLVKEGLWLEYGNNSSSYLAAVIPDEYVDGTVETTGKQIARGKNLIAVETPGRGQAKVMFNSPKYEKPFVAQF